MKKVFEITLASLLIILLGGSLTVGAAQEFVGIATGSTGGTFYPVGVTIATVIEDSIGDELGIRFSAHTSGGSAANLQMIKNEEIKMAIAGSVPTSQAYRGVKAYEGQAVENVRYVTALYPEVVQLVYRVESGIKELEDFKDKKIAVGPAGGGGSFYCPTIMETVAGINFDDFRPQYMGYSSSVQALQNNLISAAYLGASYPTSAVSEIYASPVNVDMIEFSDEDIAKLKDVAPYYAKIVIKKDTYPGQERDLNLVGFKSSLVTRKDVSEEVVYRMLKVIYLEKLNELKERQNALEPVTLDEAINGLSGAPLHPGAVKFYREQGIEIPDNLIPPEMK